VLTFFAQNDMEKVNASREVEQVAWNERKFDFVESHCKALKTTIEGLGRIHSMDCSHYRPIWYPGRESHPFALLHLYQDYWSGQAPWFL
jgi:hypothetical protein